MKKILLGFCLLAGVTISNAQKFSQISSDAMSMGAIYHTRKEILEIEGSPLISNLWLPGTIILESGSELQVESLNYSVYDRKILFKKGSEIYEVDKNLKVESFILGDVVFKKVEFKEEKIFDFVEVLYSGSKMGLFKRYKCTILAGRESTGAIPATSDKFVMLNDLLVEKNGDLGEISLKKKDVLNLLKDKADAIETYVNQNHYSYKNEEHIVTILNFYDSI